MRKLPLVAVTSFIALTGLWPALGLAASDDANAPTGPLAAVSSDAGTGALSAPTVPDVAAAPEVEPAELPEPPAPAPQGPRGASAPHGAGRTAPVIGIGVDLSTLGIGGQVAVKVLPRANVRVGFNAFGYSHTLTSSGITYAGQLTLRSASATFDYFLWGTFHISPGVLFYNANGASATASVPPGQTFTLNGTTYESSTSAPVTGNTALAIGKVAPEILFGHGNMIPRGKRHWGVEVEGGIAYQGAPAITLGLSGTVCAPPNSSGPTCTDVGTNASVQSNIQAQQSKLNHDFSFFRFYPVAQVGFSYAF